MSTGYSVEHLPDGVVVRGAVPIIDYSCIVKIASDRGFNSLLPGVADAIGATLVLSSKKHANALKHHFGVSPNNPDWLKSGDCGVSSKTIFAVLSKNPGALDYGPGDAPHDADDFGRCARLLLRFPDWVTRLSEVAHFCPAFTPLVDAWPELTTLYTAQKFVDLTHRIRELRSST